MSCRFTVIEDMLPSQSKAFATLANKLEIDCLLITARGRVLPDAQHLDEGPKDNAVSGYTNVVQIWTKGEAQGTLFR